MKGQVFYKLVISYLGYLLIYAYHTLCDSIMKCVLMCLVIAVKHFDYTYTHVALYVNCKTMCVMLTCSLHTV